MPCNNLNHFVKLCLKRSLDRFNLYKKSPLFINQILRDRDYYTVLEFPKCGRTWLRYMINQAESIKYDIPLINTMNDVQYPESKLPRVFYVHGFSPEFSLKDKHYKKLFNKYFGPNSVIFMVRNPIRVMISYYHQCVYRNHIYNGPINDFIRDPNYGIEKYVEYIEFYMKNLAFVKNQNGTKYKIIKYEDLQMNTFDILKQVLMFVDLDLDDKSISCIVENSTFKKMQEIERMNKFKVPWISQFDHNDNRTAKVRNGSNEEVTSYFSKSDLDFINSKYINCKYFTELGYN